MSDRAAERPGATATLVGPRPVDRVPTLVSVIVPVRNGAATLADQVRALAAQTLDVPWELLLADNGSSDDTVSVFEGAVRAVGPDAPWGEARVIDASDRAGSAHARNVGAAAARGDLLCFCDADDVVQAGWLRALVEVSAEHHLVGGRLETATLNSARVRGWRPAPVATHDRVQRFAPSGNLAVWADCYAALGGLDEDYLKSHDVEFSKRATASGAALGFAPDAVVSYRLRSTLRGLAHQSYRAGRASVQMAAQFPERETPITVGSVASRVVWSVVRLPYLALADRRGIWVRRTAEVTGVVVASGRQRIGRPGRRAR